MWYKASHSVIDSMQYSQNYAPKTSLTKPLTSFQKSEYLATILIDSDVCESISMEITGNRANQIYMV